MLIYTLCFALQGFPLGVSVYSGQTACHCEAPDLERTARRVETVLCDSCFSGADQLQGNSGQLGYWDISATISWIAVSKPMLTGSYVHAF